MDKFGITFPDGYKPRREPIRGIRVGIVEGTIESEGWSIGIDPGVNFGITTIQGHTIKTMYGKLPKQKKRIEYARDALELAFNVAKYMPPECLAIVEDAAFNKTFGQVGLSEVRTGFYLGLTDWLLRDSVRVMPPMTVRKLAFGNGRTQAMDLWPLLNHNAADSIGMALAALKLKEIN